MKKKEVVNVFLHYDYSSFLLQLRDLIPTIENPGEWGAFGGAIEVGEKFDAALYRELIEELGVSLNTIYTFRTFHLQNIICHFFYSELHVPLSKLSLNEGVEMGLFTIDEILQESLYSQELRTFFPVSPQFLKFFNEFLKFMKSQEFIRKVEMPRTTELH
jgi:8-oxo-dGTP diphosphatase